VIEIHEIDNGSDAEFLRACQRGDVAAFASLYRRHAPVIMRFAWSKLRDRSQAEDLVQETFTTAWSKIRASRIVDESLLPWLLAICGNHIRNQLRRNAKHSTIALLDDATPARTGASDLTAIDSAMESLSPIDRLVCELCLIDGFSYKEAAAMVGTTASAVRNRLHRSRAQLRDLLADD
jgi:RNA polymerase sigma-70 factor (ECF subfamily)